MKSHPENFKIDIEQHKLKNYLRRSWFRSWFCGLGLIFGILLLLSIMEYIEYVGEEWKGRNVRNFVFFVVGAFVGFYGFVWCCYLGMSHWRADKVSKLTELEVCGPFLRIKEFSNRTLIDRKIHFRAITDFSIVEDKTMRKFGIKSLMIHTTGGGMGSVIRVTGVKDCESVRDTLAEVDALREQ